ncbi:hypothetical protein [Paraburkholderia antibiotica]|uniref:Uncharacterized protein n=1 Tax=Paraburkholderia antibiotica TaxID=2728839 RepID=A0A7X9X0N2_9BURK|nr:hypothetical protein [Paraburkholderia antibiotica]NML29276.1 hypothetical protein [Paraburkholderia antibiotica]
MIYRKVFSTPLRALEISAEFASTAVQPAALFDADATEAIRHSAVKTFA